ncbi:TolC family protein [Tsuneonella sp. HG222]
MQARTLAILLSATLPATALQAQAAPPQSLQVDPQQGATPRPPAPVEPTTQLPVLPQESEPVQTQPLDVPVQTLGPPPEIPYRQPDVTLSTPEAALPSPSADPLALDRSSDPVLALAEGTTDPGIFAAAIRRGVDQHPSLTEAEADRAEAKAARNEARALELPVIDFNMTYFRVIDRAFSNDPQNILERSRPRERTDAILQVNQPVIDFGKTQARIDGANERLAAADANIDDYASRLALSSIAAWYQVFTYRALERLGEAFVANQDELRGAIEKRIAEGVSAPADLAQYDSYRASALAQLADFQRQLSTSEAQYAAYIGQPAPPDLGRAPAARDGGLTFDALMASVDNLPAVERARRLSFASRFETKAMRAMEKPSVSVGVNAGRYGVFENDRDYDIRASVTLSQRFLGGAKQRTDQSQAREMRAQATYDRVRLEAERDAQIAYADVQALERSAEALRENYFASRQARDALFERFRFARGTLYDVLQAQTNYFNVAVRFVAAVSELDIARYNMLARSGQLLDTLDIEHAGASD